MRNIAPGNGRERLKPNSTFKNEGSIATKYGVALRSARSVDKFRHKLYISVSDV